MHGLVIS